MSNTEIITQYKITHNIPTDTPLYTAGVWYNKGYKIKRGSVCKHRIEMVKQGKERYYKKNFDLFGLEQVERR